MAFVAINEGRFNAKIRKDSGEGCWVWTGATDPKGYGRFRSDGGSTKLAHRLSYELHVGAIPPGEGSHGTCVCHRCDNPSCVNPSHLFLGSNKENMLDAAAKERVAKKLTGEDVREIRSLYATGNYTQKALGEMYGVSLQNAHNIVHRKVWVGV